MCENWIRGCACPCIFTQEKHCPHIGGSRYQVLLCRQPWAHLELLHTCRMAPGLCSCRSWSRSRNCQWVMCAVAAGSICSTSQDPKESAKIGHAFGRHTMKLCIGMAFSEGGSLGGRQRISWSQNMFTLLSCYLLEPLAGLPLDCPSP